jgi:hypothetical protein
MRELRMRRGCRRTPKDSQLSPVHGSKSDLTEKLIDFKAESRNGWRYESLAAS